MSVPSQLGKRVFTIGQVSKICGLASRTIVDRFDAGELRGYRVPGSQDRRIPREHLVAFLKTYFSDFGPQQLREWDLAHNQGEPEVVLFSVEPNPPSETILPAVRKRLREELGFTAIIETTDYFGASTAFGGRPCCCSIAILAPVGVTRLPVPFPKPVEEADSGRNRTFPLRRGVSSGVSNCSATT